VLSLGALGSTLLGPLGTTFSAALNKTQPGQVFNLDLDVPAAPKPNARLPGNRLAIIISWRLNFADLIAF
jgi:hypothetical protein